MTTNGFPTHPPATPIDRPLLRRLVTEVYYVGVGGREETEEFCEPTIDDVQAWLDPGVPLPTPVMRGALEPGATMTSGRYRLVAELAHDEAGSRREIPVIDINAHVPGIMAALRDEKKVEPVRMVGAERAEVGKMPSVSDYVREHINNHEFGTFRDEGQAALATCRAIVAYLDEQAMKGPNR